MPPSRSLDGIRPYIPQPKPAAPTRPSRRSIRVPNVFLYGIIGAYLYIISAPFLPAIHLSRATKTLPPTPSAAVLASVPAPSTPSPTPIPGPNHLTIDKISVDGDIHEGPDESTLEKGIWHIPGTSTPDKGGNTVLAAHRFEYLTGGNTFYALDKVAVGDHFTILWNGIRYNYEVYESTVVTSRDIQIENNTPDPEVTLYTCTPLWTSTNRLVVKAHLIPS